MEYTIGLDGFVSFNQVVRAAAHGIWDARSRCNILASAAEDWLIAERLVTPSQEDVRRAAYEVSLLRASDGTEGDPYHDWLYAELVLAVQAYRRLLFEGFVSALKTIEDREFRMGL